MKDLQRAPRPDDSQSLGDHVKALRRVVLVSLGAVAVAFVILFYGFCDPLVNFILRPVTRRGISVIATAVTDALVMRLRVCLVGGVICAAPVIIGMIWSFVAPALYPREKKIFGLLFLGMAVLFCAGVVFCYTVIFPLTVDLFREAGSGMADSLWNVKDYFQFVLSFVVPFGIMFELPAVMYMLAKKGMITYPKAAKARKYVLLAVSVLAAILTPPDVVSQIMLMLPMMLLYEISLQIIRFARPQVKG